MSLSLQSISRFFVLCALILFVTASVACADNAPYPFAAKIRAWIESNASTLEKAGTDPNDIESFYENRVFAPAWHTGTDWQTGQATNNEPLNAFLSSFRETLAGHGLEAKDYPLDLIETLKAANTPDNNVAIDVLITASLLHLGQVLHGEGLNLGNLYPGWNFEPEAVAIPALLESAIEQNDIKGFLAELAPTSAAYADLSRLLAKYRAMQPWATNLAASPSLHGGEQDSRIPLLRARLRAEGYDTPDPAEGEPATTYDAVLEDVVKNYQIHNGLKADGAIGAQTVSALNTPLSTRIGQILANMERWRHMPRVFPDRYVQVNIPDYTLDLIENGQSVYRDAVVVGQVDRKTPFIHSAIRSVIFNPSWHVPASIARKDILPKLRRDPHYLEKMGLVINGSAEDPHGAAINWHQIKESTFAKFRLRQTPGDMNSLGRLKFDFDNDFSVYMHGTPHQNLFSRPTRHFSSGCVRIQDPTMFAQLVLKPNEGNWDEAHVKSEIDKDKTKWLKITQPVPLFIVYWTVLPRHDDGPGVFRADVYDYDRFLIKTLDEERSITHK